jgi:hypothetical protein
MTAADQFAQWLGTVHPDIYAQLYAHAKSLGVGTRTLSGFGDDSTDPISADEVTVTADAPVDASSYSPDAPIQDIGVDTSSIDTSVISAPNVVTSPDSGSSGGVLSALSSVGSWLVSPQGLTSLAQVGTAVLKVQQAQTVANAQLAVIQANAQRAAAGQSPVPISYVTDSTGHLVPVYETGSAAVSPTLETAIAQGRATAVTLPDGSTGYTLDQPTLNSLLGVSVPWYVWAAGALLLVLLAR